jgi:hypothetical protein
MEELPDKITVQCRNCFGMINTNMDELQEDNQLSCYHCFHIQPIDVEKIIKGMAELMKKVHDLKKD